MPAVVIPWRGGDADRERALHFVIDCYRALGWPVTIGGHTIGPWNKPKAIANAVAGTDADILVIADGDVLCDKVEEAVDRCVTYVQPWRRIYRLSKKATDLVYAGADPKDIYREPDMLHRRVYGGVVGGGLLVCKREVYESCPLDPRFEGWGGEDVSWGHALQALHGPSGGR